jgi:hypothetical protein
VFLRGSAVRQQGGFNADFKYVIDLDYVLALLDQGKMWVDSVVGAGFRMHPGSLTHQGLDKAEQELTRCFSRHTTGWFDENAARKKIRGKRFMKATFLRLIGHPAGRWMLRTASRLIYPEASRA